MITLMKYEMRKTWYIKLILLALTAVAEVVFLVGLMGNMNDVTVTGIGLLTFLAFTGVAVIGLGTVIVLHRDMNTKQAVMLFMTPHSSYTILGAKVLENFLSIALAGAFFFALGALDITLLFAHEAALDRLWSMVSEFLRGFNEELTFETPKIAAILAQLFSGWFLTVVTACLADVLSASVLSGKRFSGLISFALFLLLSWFLNWVRHFFFIGGTFTTVSVALWSTLINLVFSALMYWVTAWIMDHRLSV